jgi:hypothetical protein
MPDFVAPIINGHRYSFSSIDLHANGKLFYGVTKIAYRSSLKPGVIRGTDAEKIGRTPGEAEHTCELEMLQQEFQVLVDSLGPGFGLAVFDVQVVFAEQQKFDRDGPEPEGVKVHDILGCRITDVDFQSSTGVEANTVRLTLDPRTIAYGTNLTIEAREAADLPSNVTVASQ